jgi:hypothetical protein
MEGALGTANPVTDSVALIAPEEGPRRCVLHGDFVTVRLRRKTGGLHDVGDDVGSERKQRNAPHDVDRACGIRDGQPHVDARVRPRLGVIDDQLLLIDVEDKVTVALLRTEVLTVDVQIAALPNNRHADDVWHELAVAPV